VKNESLIAVQVFDQKKFKKKDQGFLGVVNVQMGNVFDVAVGGDGKLCVPFFHNAESHGP
jgi:E3 ubiquitin-protein ligase NEDD4